MIMTTRIIMASAVRVVGAIEDKGQISLALRPCRQPASAYGDALLHHRYQPTREHDRRPLPVHGGISWHWRQHQQA